MNRAYYADQIRTFLNTPIEAVIGKLALKSEFPIDETQRDAWREEINLLQATLSKVNGSIYFEFLIPRMGRRIDVVLLIGSVVFVLEFKVGEQTFQKYAEDQVWDYALDLKNFHETSHAVRVVPILVATEASTSDPIPKNLYAPDGLATPIRTGPEDLAKLILAIASSEKGSAIEHGAWESGRYSPTPTIIEAALSLYNNHSVDAISRSDAGAINLSRTSTAISRIIKKAREERSKSICFVTGVPGAGKTLAGLNVATSHFDKKDDLYSVFLSGNGPLVKILNEALARDRVQRGRDMGKKVKIGDARSEVKAFVQNIHHFRDECLRDTKRPPVEHVVLFDEAQRAWDITQTSNFMKRKKGIPHFDKSEPEYLISCMDRHADWAVIVCLVGGGQEINTGEAGIGEWIESLNRTYPKWHVHISPKLTDSEYAADDAMAGLRKRKHVFHDEALHLAVSMRSYRAENVSLMVKQMLDLDMHSAQVTCASVSPNYPITLTRNLGTARAWLRNKARGSERYGMVVSSSAERLKPHALDVRSPMDPVHWFLDSKSDVRSSYYLEDVATEFHVQGLELDWACVTWDADFRFTTKGWEHRSFVGHRWNNVNSQSRKRYLKNAYRVLLTRARQGMVVVVPEGDSSDPTRRPEFYDPTFEYLKEIGLQVI